MHGMNSARTCASKLAEGRHSTWLGTSRMKLRIALGISAGRHAPLEMQGVIRDAARNSVDATRSRRSWPSLRWLERSAAVMGGCFCLALSACGGTSSRPTPALRATPAVTPALSHASVASSRGSVEFVYLAEPSARARVVTRGALERTAEVIRERLGALGIGAARVSVSGANEITVSLPNVSNAAQAEREVAGPLSCRFMTGRRTR